MATTPRDKRTGKTVSAKPGPLRLTGNRLEDFLPLSRAEDKLRDCAATGEVCVVDGFANRRPDKASSKNTVRGTFLRYMLLGGCEESPVSDRGIRLTGAFVTCKSDGCLNLESATIDTVLFLDHCTVDGQVRLTRCRAIELNLIGTRVTGIDADGLTAVNGVRLQDGFVSSETIRLRNARIGGNLVLHGAEFLDPNNAIIANRARIEGDVDLGKARATGTIALTGSEIGGDFTPQGAVLEGKPALQLRNTRIGGTLHWRGLGFVDGEVDLTGAACKTLNTGTTSWLRKRAPHAQDHSGDAHEEPGEGRKPTEYHTKLDNFTYDGFTSLPDSVQSKYWIEWLNQQPEDHLGARFKPRPWEQLAGVLQSMGYEEEARDVRIEKQKLLTRFMIRHEKVGLSVSSLWHWLQILFRVTLWGPMVSYGYRPGNAVIWLFLFVLAGTVVYHQAATLGVMAPTQPLVYKEAGAGGTIPAWCAENWVYFPDESCAAAMPSEYSEFHAFIYAADVALPVVNLRMEDDWSPRVVYTDGTRSTLGLWVRGFEWFLISVGWILSLLFVSAVGSSIRR